MLAAAVKTWRICTSVPQTVTIGASVKLNFQIWKWEDWNPDILNFGCLMESVLRITASCWQLTFGSRWSENLIWPITLPPCSGSQNTPPAFEFTKGRHNRTVGYDIMLITSVILVQKKFHRDLGTKWVDEQFSLKKNFLTGPTRALIFLLRSLNFLK